MGIRSLEEDLVWNWATLSQPPILCRGKMSPKSLCEWGVSWSSRRTLSQIWALGRLFPLFCCPIGLKTKEGLLWWLSDTESTCQCRRLTFDPWDWKIPWRRNDNPLQYSCLDNLLDRGAWQVQFMRWQRVTHDRATEEQQREHKVPWEWSRCLRTQQGWRERGIYMQTFCHLLQETPLFRTPW